VRSSGLKCQEKLIKAKGVLDYPLTTDAPPAYRGDAALCRGGVSGAGRVYAADPDKRLARGIRRFCKGTRGGRAVGTSEMGGICSYNNTIRLMEAKLGRDNAVSRHVDDNTCH